MSTIQWAYTFKSLVDIFVEFFDIEILPGSGITFMSVFVWVLAASFLIYFIKKAFD